MIGETQVQPLIDGRFAEIAGRHFHGIREPEPRGARVYVRDSLTTPPYPLKHVVYHSPDGFEWGYGGSGPADLALSLAAAVIGKEAQTVALLKGRVGVRAWNVHQTLKDEVVAGLPHESWILSEASLQARITEIEAR